MNYKPSNSALLVGVTVSAWVSQSLCSNAQIITNRSTYSTIDLKHAFAKADVRLLGLQNAHTALFVTQTNWRTGSGSIVRWNLAKKTKAGQAALSKWLWNFPMALSPDGTFLVTGNNRMSPEFADVKTYRTTILDSTSIETVATLQTLDKEDIVGYLFDSNDNSHVIVKTGSLLPTSSKDDFVFGRDRFDWLNLKTAKVDKQVFYNPARGCSKILSSPDHKFLATLFYSEAFAPYGDNDYLVNKRDRSAIVDILDARSGKILWHLEGSEKRPVGDPLFFISPTRFISAATVFDIQKRTSHPWGAVNDKRQCLAAVPHHPDFALFLTPDGLQLRNWRKNKTLVSWPTLQKPGRILFSPDLSVFSFKRGSLVQFWKFDSKWLR